MDNLNLKLEKQKSGYLRQRWGAVQPIEQENQSNLLVKKDMQIKRLQAELENEKKKTDNALKMLESFRNSHKIQVESTTNTQSELSRRLKAEEDLRKLKGENEKLKMLIVQHIESLSQHQKEMQGLVKN